MLSMFFFFKQKTAYEMRISDWSSDVCSSDLVDHPIVRTHPETGRQCLYLGRRANATVVGVPEPESEAMLDALWAHAVQDRFVWYQRWRPGDLVIWDNRCTMHRRNGFNADSRRILHRTQTLGARPY